MEVVIIFLGINQKKKQRKSNKKYKNITKILQLYYKRHKYIDNWQNNYKI